MGMYTGLRFKAIIKEEYREAINELMERDTMESWLDTTEGYPEMEFAKEYAEMSRSDFIPFGSLAYMPDEWEELIDESKGKQWNNYKAAKGWEREFNIDTGYWQFQCSLKNYGSEIEKFLKDVASVIVKKAIHVEVHYEEDRYGRLHELVDGEWVENESKSVDYRPWEDENSNYY